jgi:hypothetical protein
MVANQRATRLVGKRGGETITAGLDRPGDRVQATAAFGLGQVLPGGLGGSCGADCRVELGGVGSGEGGVNLAPRRVDDVELLTVARDEATVDQKMIRH